MAVNIHWRPDGVPSLGAKPARCSDHSGAGTAECTNHYYTLLLSLLFVAAVAAILQWEGRKGRKRRSDEREKGNGMDPVPQLT